jgi:hypothetical protein
LFANRYTAFIDACSLAGALKRNLLLTLAEAGFYRVRWSERVLDETRRAIQKILEGKGVPDAVDRGTRAVELMKMAFEDAMVSSYDDFMCVCDKIPDGNDRHVLAAALKTQAAIIVTDNIRHFPSEVVAPLNIEACTSDEFIANTIALDAGKAVAAVRTMRQRLKNPGKTVEILLLDMEAAGLLQTVDFLRPEMQSL